MDERERRQQAREAWRKARDEMREAFRRAWREGRFEDESGRRQSFEEFIQNLVAKAREFGSEIGEDARRFGRSFAEDARKQADEALKGIREDWRERQREYRHQHRREDWQEHWLFGGRRFQHWAEGDEEANPFLAAMLSRGGGLLSVYVLHLLAEQPRYGNDLMKEIERRTVGGWTSNPGAVYPLLSNMESNGLVLSNWEEPDKRTRRIYQITDRGREELSRLKQMLRPKLMDTIDVLHDIYDDLYGAGSSEGSSDERDTTVDTETPADGESMDQGQHPTEMHSSSVAGLMRNGARSLIGRVLGPNPGQVGQTGN